jgi:3-hydroxyacyl-[acyl-carrier-protein] dehydratase
MAQIGLACLGVFLLKEKIGAVGIAMTTTEIEFLKPVFPTEKVTVTSEKIYFRFNKLKCKVKMENEKGEIVCKGTIAGMLIENSDGK